MEGKTETWWALAFFFLLGSFPSISILGGIYFPSELTRIESSSLLQVLSSPPISFYHAAGVASLDLRHKRKEKGARRRGTRRKREKGEKRTEEKRKNILIYRYLLYSSTLILHSATGTIPYAFHPHNPRTLTSTNDIIRLRAPHSSETAT